MCRAAGGLAAPGSVTHAPALSICRSSGGVSGRRCTLEGSARESHGFAQTQAGKKGLSAPQTRVWSSPGLGGLSPQRAWAMLPAQGRQVISGSIQHLGSQTGLGGGPRKHGQGAPIRSCQGAASPGQLGAAGPSPSLASQCWGRASRESCMTPRPQHSGGGGQLENAWGSAGRVGAGRSLEGGPGARPLLAILLLSGKCRAQPFSLRAAREPHNQSYLIGGQPSR